MLPLAALVPYAGNPKRHPKLQVANIAASIQRFGFLVPLVIDKDNVIVAGHGRFEAASQLGMTELPCIRADHLTEMEIKAYRLADNKLAESRWDDALLELELGELKLADFDTGTLGFPPPKELSERGTVPPAYKYSLIVRCKNEQEQAALLEELEQRGFTCELLTS